MLLALLLFLVCSARGHPLHPVILVPGDGGSQLEAKLNKSSVVHYLCQKRTDDFYSLWLNLEMLVPFVLDCFIDNMRLVYDNATRTTYNADGVEIRIPGFGNTSTVEWLDPSQAYPTSYLKQIADVLVDAGLERGTSIRGAPFDFRKAPNELADYFVNLKTLVESTARENGNRSVTMLAHSMGAPVVLYFLNGQTAEWKSQYIESLVTLAGVWGGAVKAMRVFASGDSLGIYFLSPLKLRAQQRTSPSLAFLLPSPTFWDVDDPLIFTSSKNYSLTDMEAFFQHLNFTIGYEMYKDTKHFIPELKAPGVQIHCLYGLGIATDETVSYKAGKFPDYPDISYGEGDGTVNQRSLEGCLQFRKGQAQPVHQKIFKNVNHLDILKHPLVLDYVKNVVLNATSHG